MVIKTFAIYSSDFYSEWWRWLLKAVKRFHNQLVTLHWHSLQLNNKSQHKKFAHSHWHLIVRWMESILKTPHIWIIALLAFDSLKSCWAENIGLRAIEICKSQWWKVGSVYLTNVVSGSTPNQIREVQNGFWWVLPFPCWRFQSFIWLL